MKATFKGLAAVAAVCAIAAVSGPAPASGDESPVGPVRGIDRPADIASAPFPSLASVGDSSAGSTVTSSGGTTTAVPLGERSVINADNRTRVTDTTTYPNSAIGQLTIVLNGSSYICTGWLIDANTILTSGHCAYNPTPDGGQIISSGTFAPGRNGLVDPFGSCNVLQAYAPTGWRIKGLAAHDWSLMQLDCTVGDTAGWFGLFWKGGVKALKGLNATVQGYPAEKAFGSMWTMAGTIADSTKSMVFYRMDTTGGQSGSPVFRPTATACGGPCAMAVHSYGVGGSGLSATNNSGPRITEARYNLIQDLADDNTPTP